MYAAYLYDAVNLYAKALDKLIRQEPIVDDEVIDNIASNGTRITETIIGLGSYISKFKILKKYTQELIL